MKKASIFLLSLIPLMIAAQDLESEQREVFFDVGGDLASFLFDNETGIYYRISHDTAGLYIETRFVSQETKMKILSSGFTVWLDPRAKKKKKFGISLVLPDPGEINTGLGMDNRGIRERRDRNQMLNLRLSAINELEIHGKMVNEGYIIPVSESGDIRSALLLDDNNVLNLDYYISREYLADLFSEEFILFSVGFECVPKMPEPGSGGMNGRPGGMGGRPGGGGRMGGGPGGMGPGSGMNSNRVSREEMSQPIKLWIKEVSINKE